MTGSTRRNGRLRAALGLLALALLAPAGVVAARPGHDGGERTYDLTSPPPVLGERVLSTTVIELLDGQASGGMRHEDLEIALQARGRARHDEQVERTVEAVTDGRISRLRRHTAREETAFDLEMVVGDERKTEKDRKTGDEHGKTVISERTADSWRHTMDGAAVAEELARRLTHELDTPDPLGRNGVRIGESWPLDAAALGIDPGADELQTTGRGEVTLDRVGPCSQGGGACAYLALRARFELRSTGDVTLDGHIELEGTVERELGAGFDRRLVVKGPLELSIRGEHDGVQVQGSVGGRLELTIRQARTVPGKTGGTSAR